MVDVYKAKNPVSPSGSAALDRPSAAAGVSDTGEQELSSIRKLEKLIKKRL